MPRVTASCVTRGSARATCRGALYRSMEKAGVCAGAKNPLWFVNECKIALIDI